MSAKVYEADGPIIRKLPVETKTETGIKISIGFPVCTLTEWCDEQGEAVAELMNRGEAYASSQAEIERLRASGREFMEAAEAVFDWMNGNDLSADHEEQHPDDFERVSKALVAFRAALSGSKE